MSVNWGTERSNMTAGMDADEARMLERSDAAMQAALLPIQSEIETQRVKRNQRNPIDQFSMTQAALQKGSGMEEKIRQGSGLNMGNIFELGRQSKSFLGDAFNAYSSRQAKSNAANTSAISALVGQGSQVSTAFGTTALQTSGSMSQSKWQSYSDMLAAQADAEAQAKAAGMGMMGGILGAALGSDWFAGLEMFE